MTPINNLFKSHVEASISLKSDVLMDTGLIQNICDSSQLLIKAIEGKGKIMFAGNGGSAADAQHLATEFVSKLEKDRDPLPALALTTDTSVLTAIGNDYGFDEIFSRQIKSLARAGDVFFGITTSGASINVLNAFKICKNLGISTIALCGSSGSLEDLSDIAIKIPSSKTALIQECHIMVGHILCKACEEWVLSDQS
jgi:D-sedoheptulose 7-phosphate isomerase